MLDREPL